MHIMMHMRYDARAGYSREIEREHTIRSDAQDHGSGRCWYIHADRKLERQPQGGHRLERRFARRPPLKRSARVDVLEQAVTSPISRSMRTASPMVIRVVPFTVALLSLCLDFDSARLTLAVNVGQG